MHIFAATSGLFGHKESLVIMILAQNRSFLSGFFIYFLKCQKKSVEFANTEEKLMQMACPDAGARNWEYIWRGSETAL